MFDSILIQREKIFENVYNNTILLGKVQLKKFDIKITSFMDKHLILTMLGFSCIRNWLFLNNGLLHEQLPPAAVSSKPAFGYRKNLVILALLLFSCSS